MAINEKFSSLLFYRRTGLGYTQEYVAERCGLTSRQVQILEKGASLPSLENALKLAVVLDFSLDALKSEVKDIALSIPCKR